VQHKDNCAEPALARLQTSPVRYAQSLLVHFCHITNQAWDSGSCSAEAWMEPGFIRGLVMQRSLFNIPARIAFFEFVPASSMLPQRTFLLKLGRKLHGDLD